MSVGVTSPRVAFVECVALLDDVDLCRPSQGSILLKPLELDLISVQVVSQFLGKSDGKDKLCATIQVLKVFLERIFSLFCSMHVCFSVRVLRGTLRRYRHLLLLHGRSSEF